MLLYNKNIRNSSLHVPPVGMVFFNNIFWFPRDIKCLAVHKSHTLIINFSNIFKIAKFKKNVATRLSNLA